MLVAERVLHFIQGNDSATVRTLEQLEHEELKKLINKTLAVLHDFVGGKKPQVKDLHEEVHKYAMQAIQKGKSRCKDNFRNWLEKALKNGAGPAHRWANMPSALPTLQLFYKSPEGDYINDPVKVAEHHAVPWTNVWQL